MRMIHPRIFIFLFLHAERLTFCLVVWVRAFKYNRSDDPALPRWSSRHSILIICPFAASHSPWWGLGFSLSSLSIRLVRVTQLQLFPGLAFSIGPVRVIFSLFHGRFFVGEVLSELSFLLVLINLRSETTAVLDEHASLFSRMWSSWARLTALTAHQLLWYSLNNLSSVFNSLFTFSFVVSVQPVPTNGEALYVRLRANGHVHPYTHFRFEVDLHRLPFEVESDT